MKDPREELDEKAQERAKAARKRELDNLRKLLGSVEGYSLVCRILDRCRVFDSIWSPSAEIHKNAGAQELGQWLFREVAQAAPEALTRMFMDITIEEPVIIGRTKEK